MKILGIIGRNDEPLCHDAAAAIIDDGKIIVALEQERLSRRKHAPGEAPIQAIFSCMEYAGLSFNQINYIAYGWLDSLKSPTWLLPGEIAYSKEMTQVLLPQSVFKYETTPHIYFIKHHRSHMASAFYTSGFTQAAGIIIDGSGENDAISFYYGDDSGIKHLRSYGLPFSLGMFYESAAYYSGLGWDAAGKLMGLTSFGKPLDDIGFSFDPHTGIISLPKWIQDRISSFNPSAHEMGQLWIEYFCKHCYPYQIGNKTDIMYYANFAASVQQTVETLVRNMAVYLKEQTDAPDLVLSGGVALNCAINSKIASDGVFNQFYVFPAAHDAGTSLGAALELYHRLEPKKATTKVRSMGLGRAFTGTEILEAFHKRGLTPIALSQQELIERVVEDLVQNRIVAWVQGRDEFGPRALGNRSLLASPVDRSMLMRLNLLKGREMWRPIAPSIQAEYAHDYFTTNVDLNLGCHMLTANVVAPYYRQKIPAVLHTDFTSRPQLVDRLSDPLYWNLIDSFRRRSGIPLLCNTSFNINGDPIVHTPEDAIYAYLMNPQIDTLVIEGWYLSRNIQ